MTPRFTERLPRPRLPISDDESHLASKQSMTIILYFQNWLSSRDFPALQHRYRSLAKIDHGFRIQARGNVKTLSSNEAFLPWSIRQTIISMTFFVYTQVPTN
jgi:hypothetical protein